MNERIAETLKVLPDAPGVYIMHDKADINRILVFM